MRKPGKRGMPLAYRVVKTATESLLRTVFGSEFQTAAAEHRKARFANAVVVEGWHSVVVVDHRLWLCSRSWIRRIRLGISTASKSGGLPKYDFPLKVPLPVGDPGPNYHMVHWFPTSTQPKRHLDPFSRFAWTRSWQRDTRTHRATCAAVVCMIRFA